jgi:hypothetical protein
MRGDFVYPSVKQVVPHDDFLLLIDFDNGERAWLDMKPFLDFGVFRQLKDCALFRQVRVSFDTIQWDSGADLDPEFVYEKSRPISSSHTTAGNAISVHP